MQLRLRLYVREHPDGRFTARVLHDPELAGYAETREEAIEQAREQAREYFEEMGPDLWASVPYHQNQRLLTVPVEIRPKGADPKDTIRISVSVVLTEVGLAEGRRVLVSAPFDPKLQMVVRDDAEAADRVPPALARRLRKWPIGRVLDLEDAGQASLEMVFIAVEMGRSRARDREDGGEAPAGEESVLEACGTRIGDDGAPSWRGRAALVERTLEALAAGSVLLVGPGDAGKTALVREMARRIAQRECPTELRNRVVWELPANAVIAGMVYIGAWQERARHLINEAVNRRAILSMGDPEAVIDAGRWAKSDNNLARMLRPHIDRGEVTLICETTAEGLGASARAEPSFVAAFRRVDVEATGPEETEAILAQVAWDLGERHRVRVEDSAVTAAQELTGRFLPYRAAPGKAVRLLAAMAGDADPGAQLDREATIRAFARETGLPEVLLSDAPLSGDELRGHFGERLLGQPEAVATLVDVVATLKAGLNDPGRPLASLFFVGPTGVGKTEAAKLLAEYMFGSRERLVRLDMGEYSGPDALARLVGTAWRGDDRPGELTRRVREQPFSVVLLDEIEKAHPDVFDALLGALGEGRLTDQAGRTTELRNAVIVMTSNLGARAGESVGFAPTEAEAAQARAHYVREAERFFRPEFFNRIDRFVAFAPLSREAVTRLARRELGRLLMREGITRRELLVDIDEAVVQHLVERGFHPRYGARPLQREIQHALVSPLAELLVAAPAEGGGLLRVSIADGRVALSLASLDEVGEERPVVEEAPPGRLEDVAARVAEVRQEIAAEAGGPRVARIRDEVDGLLAETRSPSFWDDPDAARATLGRVYRLDAVLGRLDRLVRRAESAGEWARMVLLNRDRRARGQLAEAAREMATELAYVRIALGSAAEGEEEAAGARVVVTALGPDAAGWAAEIAGMYAGWADARGLDVALETVGGGRTELHLGGEACLDLLLGEAGLHRLGGADLRCVARVAVGPLGGGEPDSGDEIVRAYARGRHRWVRDPRTGVRVGDVTAVLAGSIDPFLVAWADRAQTPLVE
jgi:ATP-dependent Clp protease ATP-binding subunit ClpA